MRSGSAATLGLLTAALAIAALGGCSAEKRPSGASQPQTPPNGPNDPRIAAFEDNSYQLSQGGRYFAWYGCSACHAQDARGVRDLGDESWAHGGAFDQVYESILHHPGLGTKSGQNIPAEQMWQLTAYVRSLNTLDPAQRRRQDFDQKGEPQAENWSGPVK